MRYDYGTDQSNRANRLIPIIYVRLVDSEVAGVRVAQRDLAYTGELVAQANVGLTT